VQGRAAAGAPGRGAAAAAEAGAATAADSPPPPPPDTRPVYWPDTRARVETPIVTLDHLAAAPIVGPAVIELPTTTIPVHPGQRAELHASGSVMIHV
jgi:N-methylhydantoinase A/oxoprolinase/acetone carboxylase beta subunit